MEKYLNAFEAMLTDASRRIEAEYFQLPVADADAVYRERVYCYELYHQLRTVWGQFPFSLGGEIDKSGHPHFRRGPYANAKPDFLIHVPGGMDRNLACLEVKPLARPTVEFTSDLQKLTWFCRNANYYRGIFLIYGADPAGPENNALPGAKVREAIAQREDIDGTLIHVFHHPAVGRPVFRVEL